MVKMYYICIVWTEIITNWCYKNHPFDCYEIQNIRISCWYHNFNSVSWDN